MAKVALHNIGTDSKVISSRKKLSLKRAIALQTVDGRVHKANAIIFSGTVKKAESQLTPIEKWERSNLGISKKELEKLKARTELDYDKLAKLLSVTRATLINKPSSELFNSALSERILGLADIYSYGYDVFEDEAKFNQWMFIQNRALGGKTPYEVCNNQFGREEVKNIIGRIDYGVYS
ncbi:MAG: antitoxin Xre/MbcA/ParS toxin-binding domain-containing protein [Saprospiraceae bacterium]